MIAPAPSEKVLMAFDDISCLRVTVLVSIEKKSWVFTYAKRTNLDLARTSDIVLPS